MADLQHHLSGNVEQYVQRIKMHDNVDAPRRIEHFADFAKIGDAKAAATALRKAGWDVSLERHRLVHAKLTVARVATVDVETADRLTTEVYSQVTTHHGEYCGWNAPVLRAL